MTDKYSWVFHFTNFEQMAELINKDDAEKERSRSRSFLGLQKHDHMHAKRKDMIRPAITNAEESKAEDAALNYPLILQRGTKSQSDTSHPPTPRHKDL